MQSFLSLSLSVPFLYSFVFPLTIPLPTLYLLCSPTLHRPLFHFHYYLSYSSLLPLSIPLSTYPLVIFLSFLSLSTFFFPIFSSFLSLFLFPLSPPHSPPSSFPSVCLLPLIIHPIFLFPFLSLLFSYSSLFSFPNHFFSLTRLLYPRSYLFPLPISCHFFVVNLSNLPAPPLASGFKSTIFLFGNCQIYRCRVVKIVELKYESLV